MPRKRAEKTADARGNDLLPGDRVALSGLLLPHGVLLLPAWLTYWALRPFSPRSGITGPRLCQGKSQVAR